MRYFARETVMVNKVKDTKKAKARLRSQLWFDNPENPGMTALYIERYLNFGLTREELMSGKPIIGIARPGPICRPVTASYRACQARA